MAVNDKVTIDSVDNHIGLVTCLEVTTLKKLAKFFIL